MTKLLPHQVTSFVARKISQIILLDDQILPEMKKVKQTSDNLSKSNKENEEGIMYRKSEKNDYSSLVWKINPDYFLIIFKKEKLLKNSEDIYDRALRGFEEKEKEQERALRELEEDFKQQKEGSDAFLKRMNDIFKQLIK